MEFHGLLPLLHDDLPDPVRRVDWATVGLYAHSKKSGQFDHDHDYEGGDYVEDDDDDDDGIGDHGDNDYDGDDEFWRWEWTGPF